MNDETTKTRPLAQDVKNAIEELRGLIADLENALQEHSANKDGDSRRTRRRVTSTINRHIESCHEVRDATLIHG